MLGELSGIMYQQTLNIPEKYLKQKKQKHHQKW